MCVLKDIIELHKVISERLELTERCLEISQEGGDLYSIVDNNSAVYELTNVKILLEGVINKYV